MKILFICHNASRTGAPLVLLHLMKWLKENTSMQMEILIVKDGELTHEFQKIATARVFKKAYPAPSFGQRLQNRLKGIFGSSDTKKEFFDYYSDKSFDVIYANSVVSAEYIPLVKVLSSTKTILHVHELQNIIEAYHGKNFAETKNYVDRYIACSKIVEENLQNSFNIQNVSLIHAFVPKLVDVNQSKEEILNDLGLPIDTFLVGGCGLIDWRKGVDFFLMVAKSLISKKENLHFVWLGGGLESNYARHLFYDLKHLGLENRVYFIGSKSNAIDFLSAFDVLLMTSREDPFPLVCIEAALVKTPIICFEKVVGSTEFVKNQVPYLDQDEMSNRILEYYRSKEKIELDGVELKKSAQEYTLEKSAQKVFDLLMSLKDEVNA